MIELEKTYLAKYLPENLKNCDFKEIIDIYIPSSAEHPKLRIRKNGDKFEMTKKKPVNGGDASRQEEQTIILNKDEFNVLNRLDGKRTQKKRYLYPFKNRIAEVDVFQNALEGLIIVDFEFGSIEEKDNFEMPDFCLVEITDEDFTAGGMICGKNFADIEKDLKRFNYRKLFL